MKHHGMRRSRSPDPASIRSRMVTLRRVPFWVMLGWAKLRKEAEIETAFVIDHVAFV